MRTAPILLAAAGLAVLAFSCTHPAEAGAQSRKKDTYSGDANARILQTWEMPDELQEISGMVWEDATHFACIQDEDGIIFRYDIAKGAVVQRIEFGNAGDYEDVTKVGNTYYVMRSDARLYEVRLQPSGQPQVQTYDVPIAKKEDIETAFYDRAGNQLLFMNKAAGRKGEVQAVYAFDLATKRVKDQPVVTIDWDSADAGGTGKKGKKSGTPLSPSALAVHPKTGDYYILNGPHSGLLIAAPDGAVKQYIQLDKKVLPQPEGIAFTPSGELYLSSEGVKGAGVIVRMAL